MQETWMKQIKENLSRRVIKQATCETKPETAGPNVNKYGARPVLNGETPRWLNVIIHGLRKEPDEDLVSTVISIGDSLAVTVYKEDVRDVYRLPKLDDRSTRPSPILVSF